MSELLPMTCIDAGFLKECCTYDPETGILVWLPRPLSHFTGERIWKTWNSTFPGRQVGSRGKGGYICTKINWKHIPVHRIAWALHTGEHTGVFIDHINGDRTDNRISNLRQATRAENNRNTKMRSDNTSGFRGIYKVGKSRWAARIKVNGARRHLGTFSRPEEASAAYNKAAREIFGEFAPASVVEMDQ